MRAATINGKPNYQWQLTSKANFKHRETKWSRVSDVILWHFLQLLTSIHFCLNGFFLFKHYSPFDSQYRHYYILLSLILDATAVLSVVPLLFFSFLFYNSIQSFYLNISIETVEWKMLMTEKNRVNQKKREEKNSKPIRMSMRRKQWMHTQR